MVKGQNHQCPVCGRALEETEDIVTCPHCGAPHHRLCYTRKGECSFAARHGESNDWHTFVSEAPEQDTMRCPVCGYQNDWSALFCFRCGESLVYKNRAGQPQASRPQPEETGTKSDWPFVSMNISSVMDPYAGLNPKEKIGEHTVEEWAAFIGLNSFYYLPRFREMEEGQKDFNYSGAFLNVFWCFFRNMKRPGMLLMLVMFLCNFLNVFISDYFKRINYAHGYIWISIFLFLILGSAMFYCGFWANQGYKKYCDQRIRSIKQAAPADLLGTLKIQGGVRLRNAYTAFAIFVVVNFIGTLFIGMI